MNYQEILSNEQIDAGVRAAVCQPGPVLVVTHGGVIRTLERHLGVEPVTAANFGGRWIETEGEVLRPGPSVALSDGDPRTIGTTDISGAAIIFVGPNREMPGFDLINFTLPESLAGAGDVPIIVTITKSGAAFSSRPSDTAPHLTISP